MAYPVAVALTNPGFETGNATGWAAIASTSGPAVHASPYDGVAAHGGSFLATAALNNAAPWWGQSYAIDPTFYADVDAGILKATVGAWRNGWSGDVDAAALTIECLDGSGNWLAERVSDYTDPAAWTQENAAVLIPPTARTIRIGLRGYRLNGTECDALVDDWTLTIDTVGSIPHRVLATAKGDSLAGWTTSSGTPAILAGSFSLSYFGSATSQDVGGFRDVAIPADLIGAVDRGLATLRSFFQLDDGRLDGADKGRFWIDCQTSAGGTTLGTLQSAAANTRYPVPFQGFDLSLAIPAGTRSLRLNWFSQWQVGTPSDAGLTRMTTFISANVISGRRRLSIVT